MFLFLIPLDTGLPQSAALHHLLLSWSWTQLFEKILGFGYLCWVYLCNIIEKISQCDKITLVGTLRLYHTGKEWFYFLRTNAALKSVTIKVKVMVGYRYGDRRDAHIHLRCIHLYRYLHFMLGSPGCSWLQNQHFLMVTNTVWLIVNDIH